MNLIVAVDLNWGIGYRGRQPFYIRKDLKRFRELTMGKTVIMGRKTYEDIGKPLDGRHNIIMSRDVAFKNKLGNKHKDVKVCQNSDQVLENVSHLNKDDIFVIGGASVYELFLEHCKRAYVTKVAAQFEVDTYFSNLATLDDWREIESSEIMKQDLLDFRYVLYERTIPKQ